MLEVIPAARNLFSRVLPRKAFLYARSIWSSLSLDLPSLVSFWFMRRRLEVRGFGGGGAASDLVKQLRSVNALAPTKMCRVMTKYGSDKGYRRHNFTTVYSVLFEGRLDQRLRLFELGIGTNNPELPSTRGGRWATGRVSSRVARALPECTCVRRRHRSCRFVSGRSDQNVLLRST